MRWLPKSIPYLVVSIAVYFVCHFGSEAFRILTSSVYGLDHPGFSNVVHGIGARLALDADGLIRLGAFLGAVKLTIAVLFAVYLCGRISSLFGREADHELVDAAVILIVSITVVAAIPAVLDRVGDVLGQYRLPLWLAGLAATLSMIERVMADEQESARNAARHRRVMIYDVTLPPKRNRVSTLRWDALRRSVNANVRIGG
jgi:hypothetical protein